MQSFSDVDDRVKSEITGHSPFYMKCIGRSRESAVHLSTLILYHFTQSFTCRIYQGEIVRFAFPLFQCAFDVGLFIVLLRISKFSNMLITVICMVLSNWFPPHRPGFSACSKENVILF